MIFVTVGTHEQPFNRLVKYMDRYAESNDEKVITQIGFSTYEPKHCSWSKFYSYQQILKFVDEARIVITHGGPSSFIMPLQIGKIPIVVPRKKEFDEHVNDHQVKFANVVAKRQGNIIVVENVTDLSETIKKYNLLVEGMPSSMKCNNAKFCEEFTKIVKSLGSR